MYPTISPLQQLQTLFDIDSRAKEVQFEEFKKEIDALINLNCDELTLGGRGTPFLFSLPAEVNYFFSCLDQNPNITALNFSYVSLSEEAVSFFYQNLNRLIAIKTLKWRGINSFQIEELLKRSPEFIKRLSKLDFSGDAFTVDVQEISSFVKSLCSFLMKSSIKVLFLNDRNLSDRDLKGILEANTHLSHLEASHNTLTENVAKSLLECGKELKIVDLSYNKIEENLPFLDLINSYEVVYLNLSNNKRSESSLLSFCRDLLFRPAPFLLNRIRIDISHQRGFSKEFIREVTCIFSLLNMEIQLVEDVGVNNQESFLLTENFYRVLKVIEEEKDLNIVLESYNTHFREFPMLKIALLKRFFSFEAVFNGRDSVLEAINFCTGEKNEEFSYSFSQKSDEIIQKRVAKSVVLFKSFKRCKMFGPWIVTEETQIKNFEEPYFLCPVTTYTCLVLKPKKTTPLKKILCEPILDDNQGYLKFGQEGSSLMNVGEEFQIEHLFETLNKGNWYSILDFTSCLFESNVFEKMLVLLEKSPFVWEICLNKQTLLDFYKTLKIGQSFAPNVTTLSVLGNDRETEEQIEKVLSLTTQFMSTKQKVGINLQHLSLKTSHIKNLLKNSFELLRFPSNLLEDDFFVNLASQNKLVELDLSNNSLVAIDKLIPLIYRAPIQTLDLRENRVSEGSFNLFMDELLKAEISWKGANVSVLPQKNQNYSEKTLTRWSELCKLFQWTTKDS